MTVLTNNEQIALFIGMMSTLGIVLTLIIFQFDRNSKILFVGGITISISLILIYFFLIQPINTRSRWIARPRRDSISKSSTFRPTIIPPSKQVKKTVMKGACQFCGEPTLMGFTCSYCNKYFCSKHRLPEKHNCQGIVLR